MHETGGGWRRLAGSMHGFQHHHATELVAARLGHIGVALLLRTYRGLLVLREQAAVEVVERARRDLM